MHFVFFRQVTLRRPRFFSALSAAGQARGPWVHTLRRMPGSRPSTAVLGALNVADLALKNKGLLSASPSRAGDMENPTFFRFIRK